MNPLVLTLLLLICPICGTAASIVYRRAQGKPILFFGVPNAVYQDRFASGHSNRTSFAKLGGARNCLVVAVAAGRLIVRPLFPFNLMFIPEFYCLEFDVPTEQLLKVSARNLMLRDAIEIEVRSDDGTIGVLTLYIRNSDKFLDAVNSSQQNDPQP